MSSSRSTRAAELPPLLNAALARATTADEAGAIGNLARVQSTQPASDANLNEVDVHLASGATTGQHNRRPHLRTRRRV